MKGGRLRWRRGSGGSIEKDQGKRLDPRRGKGDPSYKDIVTDGGTSAIACREEKRSGGAKEGGV